MNSLYKSKKKIVYNNRGINHGNLFRVADCSLNYIMNTFVNQDNLKE